jgi:hypothetical protein
VSAGTADPGIQVFIALGVVVACRRRLNQELEGRPVRFSPENGIDASWRVKRPSAPRAARPALASRPFASVNRLGG